MSDPNSSNNIAPYLLIGFAALVYLGLYVVSLIWLQRDITRRGVPSGLLVALSAIFAWPIGLVIWWFARPSIGHKQPAIVRKDGISECPSCHFLIMEGDPRCPNCGRKF